MVECTNGNVDSDTAIITNYFMRRQQILHGIMGESVSIPCVLVEFGHHVIFVWYVFFLRSSLSEFMM